MTFATIKTEVFRRVGLGDSPQTSDVNRVTDFINRRYKRLMALPGLDQLLDDTYTFSTVVGQKQYGLPQSISRVRQFWDSTNQRRLNERTVDWLRNVDPGLTATSSLVEYWIPLKGWSATQVALNPAGIPLWVSSLSNLDTASVFAEAIRVGGVRAGFVAQAGTPMNGTIPVQLGTYTDVISVTKFFVGAAANNTVTLTDSQGGVNILAQITPGRISSRYFMVQLYPTPQAVYNINIDCRRTLEPMVQVNEEPLFPEEYHEILVEGACADEFEKRDDDRAAKCEARAKDLINDMRFSLFGNPDEIAVQRGPRAVPERISRLGGWFPAGT